MMLNTQTLQLELRPDGKYIELGGGAMPVIRPNTDVRWCQNPDGVQMVDFVSDFNAALPISTGEFDGVFSKFAIEHISWRNVPNFVQEVRRILKDGGEVCLIMPNTQAQMEHLLRTQDWADASSMLFGDNDYPENTHRAFFNPPLITKLLTEAGFGEITIVAFGEKRTDMIVQAKALPGMKQQQLQAPLNAPTAPQPPTRSFGPLGEAPPTLAGYPVVKSDKVSPFRDVANMAPAAEASAPVAVVMDGPEKGAIVSRGEAGMMLAAPPYDDKLDSLRQARKAMFDRRYFDGGTGPFGGYQHYWDFPCHEVTAQKVLALRPQSVLELGCGRGYVVKRLQDAGVIACGWDFSRHCYLTRAADHVTETDATDPASWDKVKGFDLCFSIAFLDHVPEELLPGLLTMMAQKCPRGLHGVNPDEAQGGDLTRCTRHTLAWWQERMPPGHTVVDKSELEDGRVTSIYYQGDGKVKLNLGSYTTMFHNGWTNIDVHDLHEFARTYGFQYMQWDVREGLPFGTESVDAICSSHMLEHLTYAEGRELLRECRRVLKPGGHLRISVPDAYKLIYLYNPSDHDCGCPELSHLDEMSGTAAERPTPMGKLYELLCAHHSALYDEHTLTLMMKDAHLVPSRSAFRDPQCHPTLKEGLDMFAECSLFVNALPFAQT